MLLSCIRRTRYRHRPVILGDFTPKSPDGHHAQQGEDSLKECAVDPSVGRIAEMDRDNVLENLADGEQQSGNDEIAHGFLFAEDAQDEDGFADEEKDETDEGEELIEDVEANCAIGRVMCRIEDVSISEADVEGDVAGSDRDGRGGTKQQRQTYGCAIIE